MKTKIETYRNHEIVSEFNGVSDVYMFVPANRGQYGAYAYASSLDAAHEKIDTVCELMALDQQSFPTVPVVGIQFADWGYYTNTITTIELVEKNVVVARHAYNNTLSIYVDGQNAGVIGGADKTAQEFLTAARDQESAWSRLAINAGTEV